MEKEKKKKKKKSSFRGCWEQQLKLGPIERKDINEMLHREKIKDNMGGKSSSKPRLSFVNFGLGFFQGSRASFPSLGVVDGQVLWRENHENDLLTGKMDQRRVMIKSS
jgi:hypothetical protein